MAKGNIINITRYCTHDGPGIRTTVFLKGCPLRCIWCHNPESQNREAEVMCDAGKAEVVGETVSAIEVFKEIEKDRVFYNTSGGGVTVSGGEPLFQPEFTYEILKICKKNEIHTAIETSGFANAEVLKKIIGYCDLVLFDIKETDKDRHLKYTSVPLKTILENLHLVDSMNVSIVLRVPIIPGLNDREEHFFNVKKIAASLKNCKGIEVMPYHTLGAYKYERLQRKCMCAEIKEPDKETIACWKERLRM